MGLKMRCRVLRWPWLVFGIVLLFSCNFVNTDPIKSGCEEPEKPPHSHYDYIPHKGNVQTIEYKCMEGYHLVGENIRTCNPDGEWVPEAPHCEKPEVSCPFPGHNVHSSVNVTKFFSPPGTIAGYYCEFGFVPVGPMKRTCLEDGTWSEYNPICASKLSMNRRIVSVSSQIDSREKEELRGASIVDDSTNTCSMIEGANRVTSYWKVDLLENKEVDIIVLIFGNKIDIDSSLYYGLTPDDKILMKPDDYNRSEWKGKPSEKSEFATYEYKLKEPINFRYLTIEVAPVSILSLYFCELLVLSKKEPSFGQCFSSNENFPPTTTALLDNMCYTFLHKNDASMPVAESECQKLTKGSLVTDVTDEVQQLLQLNLDAYYKWMKVDKQYRLGGHMETTTQSQKGKLEWFWNNKNQIKKFYWGPGQPNMRASTPSCLTLNGQFQWQWDDQPCDNRFNFICQHKIQRCGYPDANPLAPLAEFVKSSDIDSKVSYHCPDKFELKGDRVRTCSENGVWSGRAPTCQSIDDTIAEGHEGGNAEGLPIGAIIGIVAGIIVLLLIVIVIIVLMLRRKRGSSKIMKYSTKTESAETLDVDGKKERQNYATMEETNK